MNQNILEGTVLDEKIVLSLNDLCRACCCSEEWIIELIDEGAIEPEGRTTMLRQTVADEVNQWSFSAYDLERALTAMRLQRDLEINLAGVALALDLLNEIKALKSRLSSFDMKE